MMCDYNWRHKDEWKVECKGFTVVVSRHSEPQTERNEHEGLQRWCLYVYVYPSHPLFSKIDLAKGMYQATTNKMPLYHGCTYFKVHKNQQGEVCSVQIGADYNHLHDDIFRVAETKEDARQVFADAEELIEWMERQL